MNGYAPDHGHSGGSGRTVRAPTVDEALPYTPLSSIVPFAPDIIPFPGTSISNATVFDSTFEQEHATRDLHALNADVKNEPTSVRLEKTLLSLQQLLQSDGLTSFNFKPQPHIHANAVPPQQARPVNGTTQPQPQSKTRLSSFARMVLQQNKVAYRYPTPESPQAKGPQKQPLASTTPEPKSRPQVPAAQDLSSDPTRRHNVQYAGIQVAVPHPDGLPLSQRAEYVEFVEENKPAAQELTPSKTRVLIPSASQREDFIEFPELNTQDGLAGGLSRRRAQVAQDGDGHLVSISVDQRARSEAATEALQDQIANILEAYDQVEPDTSGAVSAHATQYFELGQVADSDAPVLATHVQTKLLSSMQAVISNGRFAEIPADQLSWIQKICEPAIGSLESISLTVSEGWDEADTEAWAQRVSTAEARLISARLMLRIMTAGREERQLYSEDFVTPIITGLKHVVDNCVIRAVEARNGESGKETFAFYSQHRKPVGNLVQTAGKVLKLLGDLIVKVDVSESTITSVEFLAKELLFVENARSDDNSTIGVQRYESVRLVAMDLIAKTFSRYPDQRTFIFDEVLTSLEKLPTTRHSARQFKLSDGKPIQLVSALLMRLIQSSATPSLEKKRRSLTLTQTNGTEPTDHEVADADQIEDLGQTSIGAMMSDQNVTPDQALLELKQVVDPLFDGAQSSAQYVVKFLIQRALTATKTGDTPYRNLLDIFAEDFLSVLGNPLWPGAELLLRTLLSNLIGLADSDKTAVAAKNMSLDLMGLIGSGISDLRGYVKSSARSLDASESDISAVLVELADEILEENQDEVLLLTFDGVHRVAIEYLQKEHGDSMQLQSAKGFLTAQWARNAVQRFDPADSDHVRPDPPKDLSRQLRDMLRDPGWLQREYEFDRVSKAQGQLAAALIALNLPCCKAFKRIFSILLTNMSSDQATLKSRSIKSVSQLLEKDKSILDRGDLVLSHVLRCVGDASSMTRDNALQLLDKCLTYKPDLESRVYNRIIERSLDAAVGVRKRAMRIMKDIYIRNGNEDVRAAIADALLQRIKDSDTGVSDLARQSFEEVWFAPFHKQSFGDDAPLQLRMALQKQITLIIRTVQRGEGVTSVLDSVLQSVLSDSSKDPAANLRVCRAMVAHMFEMLTDSDSGPGKPKQQDILETLTMFARANARLFTAPQLKMLQPYIKSLTTNDDLVVYRFVIVIFRCVFPALSSIQHTFLKSIQDSLLASVAKLGKAELGEVAACLWIIDSVLKNTERLIRMTISVLRGLYNAKTKGVGEDQQAINRERRYLLIAGSFGKACNFEGHLSSFQDSFPSLKVSSVAGLFIDLIWPFTKHKLPATLRETAFESMGMVCQAFPSQFLRNDVGMALELPFRNEDTRLEQIVLSAFKGFFWRQEKRSETGAEIKVGEGEIHGHERLANTYVGTDHEGATSAIAARFLAHILRIALSKPGELSMLATQVVASITHQGLVHPKETGPALVALETSPNTAIASIAFQEHRGLHHKHETMFEKEYMRSVYQAFQYQKDVLESPGGAIGHPLTAKLHSCYEVLKMGSAKVRRRFLSNICSRCTFELNKIEAHSGKVPEQVTHVRFCMENLAFFDYAKLDELQMLVTCLEKVVTSTGTSVAHAIETDVLKVKLEPDAAGIVVSDPMQDLATFNSHPPEPKPAADSTTDPDRLWQLATASTVLMIVWETRTWLRRAWGLQRVAKSSAALAKGDDGKGKGEKKDTGRAASRVQGITGDKFLERVASLVDGLASNDTNQLNAVCRSFAELLSVDSELRVASDDEADLTKLANGYETPSEDEAGATPTSQGKGRKRRSSVDFPNGSKRPKMRKTPTKRAPGRPRRTSASKSASEDESGDWS